MPNPPPPGKPPNARTLHDAALRHLARYSTTQAGLLRVLTRRIDRWARAAAAEPEIVAESRAAARAVVTRLVAAGAVDDAAFAAGRARSLARAGRSRRAIGAHLAARGVPPDLAALPDDPAAELSAALSFARRRRIGPFRQPPDPEQRLRDLGRLARAGFPQPVAEAALRMALDEAEALVIAARLS
jgi:regulatory protein